MPPALIDADDLLLWLLWRLQLVGERLLYLIRRCTGNGAAAADAGSTGVTSRDTTADVSLVAGAADTSVVWR